MVIEAEHISKGFDDRLLIDDLSFKLPRAGIVGVIGPNGAGKTTLIAQLSGQLLPDSGRIHFAGADITRVPAWRRSHRGLARSFQITSLFLDLSVLDNVALAVQARAGHSFRFWRAARDDARLVEPAAALLAENGLADRAGARVADLSHGERKQLELTIALATGPRLLLLDEPMAGLGAAETAAMIARLAGLKGRLAMLLVEHDMDAVFALADRVSVLVHGRVVASGTPQAIRDDSRVRAAYLGEGEA